MRWRSYDLIDVSDRPCLAGFRLGENEVLQDMYVVYILSCVVRSSSALYAIVCGSWK